MNREKASQRSALSLLHRYSCLNDNVIKLILYRTLSITQDDRFLDDYPDIYLRDRRRSFQPTTLARIGRFEVRRSSYDIVLTLFSSEVEPVRPE
jgi:hypothetical protein